MKSEPRPPMTLGNAAAARSHLPTAVAVALGLSELVDQLVVFATRTRCVGQPVLQIALSVADFLTAIPRATITLIALLVARIALVARISLVISLLWLRGCCDARNWRDKLLLALRPNWTSRNNRRC
jgi:hypothetical protein